MEQTGVIDLAGDADTQRRFERSLWLMPAAYAVHISEEYFGWAGRVVVVWSLFGFPGKN